DSGQTGGLTGLPWLVMILIGLGSTLGVAVLDRRGQLIGAGASSASLAALKPSGQANPAD
ncbi:hypothetical protein, partial [Pseudomonas aeruginosa]|uniref:hypothetical protein n=1 Tax=Pseudomonas aeruginosa TaxID=287 RepID=UPI0039C49F8F